MGGGLQRMEGFSIVSFGERDSKLILETTEILGSVRVP